MRRAVVAVAAVGAVLATAGIAPAQGLVYKPIDTNSLVVKPTDTATGIFSGTTRFLSRVAAQAIDTNGYVKTINNLFSRKVPAAPTTQSGMSPLPLPTLYPSTQYQSPIAPVLPTSHTIRR